MLIYGEKANRTHENQMLSLFLNELERRWGTSTDWILAIANSMWHGAEIDLVCILPSAIFVADFKNYKGRLTGTENGPWQADGVLVKGGQKANPYQQLRGNKFSVLDWLESKRLLSGRNLRHISAGVIFSGRIEDQLDLPHKVRSWFYTTDITNCNVLLDTLSSPQLQIRQEEAKEIAGTLGAQPISWECNRGRVRDLPPDPGPRKTLPPLTELQREALEALRNFIASDELVTFSVLGMTSTGKSRLMAGLMEEAEKIERPFVALEPNRRLANRSEVGANSIYNHLYIGKADDAEGTENSDEQKDIKIIPLRECKDDPKCVYLLDNAHLLSNSSFSTPDGKQYGSGRLLTDFFEFADIEHSARKIIFFGDPYQIQRANPEESVLSGAFQHSRELKHQSLELTQLIDPIGASTKLANAFNLVSAIREQNFSALELATDDEIRVSSTEDAEVKILEQYQSNPSSVWYLAETHRLVNTFTQGLREHLHAKNFLAPIEVGELLEVYVCPEKSNPSDVPILLVSGERKTITDVGEPIPYQQGLSWVKDGPVRFHSIECSFSPQDERKINIFEEFLTAERPELDKETAVAERVWRNGQKKKPRKEGEQPMIPGIECPLPTPTLPAPESTSPAPEFTYARYGYASTVHHAQGMTQPICYVNCEHSAGRHSEAFFRWIYSAVTVAERELVLLNISNIHHFDTAIWNAGAAKVVSEIPVGAGWSFHLTSTVSERDQQRCPPQGLDQSKDFLKSVAIWLRIANAAEQLGWRVIRVASHPYQEQYDLLGPDSELCHLQMWYNNKNVVTSMRVKEDSRHWSLLTDIAYQCLATNEYSCEADAILRSARPRLSQIGWRIVSATETAYCLAITAVRGYDERINIAMNFDKQGLVSSLRPMQCSHNDMLEPMRSLFQ
jgi:hypothetical protein